MTTLIKVDVLPLKIGKKTVEVFPSGALVDKAQDISIQTMSAADNKSPLETLKTEKKVKENAKAFVKQTLGITEKQFEKFNESVTNNDFFAYVGYLIFLLDGQSYRTFAEFQKQNEEDNEEAKADPKKLSTEETN